MSADVNPALQQLGQRLARAREACGLSLEQHADRLNMGREQLQALEAGNRDGLPEPVFVIAQARRVATSLGIQIDEEIASLRGSDGFRSQRPSRAPAPAAAPEASPDAGSGRLPARSRAAGKAAGGVLPATLAALALAAVAAAVIGLRQAEPRRAAPQSSQPSIGAGGQAKAKGRPMPASAPGPGELVLQPSGPSWLEVRSAEGSTLFRGSLEGEQRFPIDAGVEVLAGRPDLVLVRQGAAAARPMGTIDDVRWRRFRSDPSPAP